MNTKQQQVNSTKTKVDSIPDYDWLFQNDGKSGGKKKGGFLSKVVKINLKSILLSLFVYLFQALPTFVIPLATADIINAVSSITLPVDFANPVWIRILIDVLITIASILFNVPTTTLRWNIASKMLRRTSAGIRMALIRKLQSLSITYHKDMQTGKIQAKFLRDMETLDGFFSSVTHGLLLHIISVIIYTVIAIVRSGWVSLFFLLVIPVNVFLRNAFFKKVRSVNKDYRINNENMSARLSNMMEMMPITRSHGLEQTEITVAQHEVSKVESSGRKMDQTLASFGAWAFVVNHVLSICCLAFCVTLALLGHIQIGDIVLYQSLFNSISGSVTAIVNNMPSIYAGIEAVDSLSELMNATEVEVNLGKPVMPKIEGNITFDNVNYKYPNTEQWVVKDFNLDVKPGECIAIVGHSGSGKSTLINLVTGLLLPVSGQVLVDGKSMEEINRSEYRHYISVVPQNSILFSGSIKENITYGLTHYTEEDLNRVVEMANIKEFVDDLPNGLDTKIGEHGDKLSGGQRQRICIARALIRNPQILILDEATSALDNISEYQVQQAISSAIKGRTTFVVAHRLSTIRNADRIIVMDDGVCVEMGTYEQLMEKKGKFFELKNLNDLTNKKAEKELA